MIMAKTLEEARKMLSELSPADREILSGELVHEIKRVDPEIEQAWTAEAEKRAQEILDGKADLVDGETVMERMRRKVHDKI